MNMSICPYPDCYGELEGLEVCPQCGQSTKRCPACGAHVRLFASFCSACGKPAPLSDKDWVTFKGSPGCLGTYGFRPTWTFRQLDDMSPLQKIGDLLINGPCHSLLTYDGHLFAVSGTGSIMVVPLAEGVESQGRARFTDLELTVFAEPAIHNGTLYIAAGHRLFAFTLSLLVTPALVLRWHFDFGVSVPVSALLPMGDSLYVTLAHDRYYQKGSMVRLDHIAGTAPTAVCLHDGSMPSPPAAIASEGNDVLFLVADQRRAQLWCGVVSPEGEKPAWRLVHNPPSPVSPFHPIAVGHGKIFAVFTQGQMLYRIDVESAQIDYMIVGNAKRFSIPGNGHPLVVTPGSIQIPTRDLTQELLPGHNVHSQPVLFGDVAIVGMGGGEIRVLDMANPARAKVWRVPGARSEITALAPYGEILALGDAIGAVTVARFNVRDN